MDKERELSRKLSEEVRLETRGSGIASIPGIKKHQSIIEVESNLIRKDTEFDWKDRLR